MKKLLATFCATTLEELIVALRELETERDTTYVTIDSVSIRGALIEETLTDGSKVYNLELTRMVR